MCKYCEQTDFIISSNYKNVGADLRFDVENRQLDIELGYTDENGKFTDSYWDGFIDISYCPFCGSKISGEDGYNVI